MKGLACGGAIAAALLFAGPGWAQAPATSQILPAAPAPPGPARARRLTSLGSGSARRRAIGDYAEAQLDMVYGTTHAAHHCVSASG